MTSLTMTHIMCFAPGELQPQLNAVVIDQINANILTQRGLELLQGIEVDPQEKQKVLIDRIGFAFFVRGVVDLQIWRDGDTRSVNQTFYVLMSDDALRQCNLHERQLHVILSPSCFPQDSPDSDGDPVATIRVQQPTERERKEQEEDQQRRRKTAEERDRKRREQNRVGAEKHRRNPQNGT